MLELPQKSKRLVVLEGGRFIMGTDKPKGYGDGEGPARTVELSPFAIDRYAVSNTDFARFVAVTNYRTTAEREGWSYVFSAVGADIARHGSWWSSTPGADWQHPEGPGSKIDDRGDHPVVHVSWQDARAYAKWSGCRLPSEAEWEFAARGGQEMARYPWGNELVVEGEHQCNIWQGEFPHRNLAEDGFAGTCPVDTFAANGFGLYNMIGNVWEWCADWFSRDYHVRVPKSRDPAGPPFGLGKVLKGGSHLCHGSYCSRFTVFARSASAPDMTTSHVGFRVAKSINR